MHPYYKRLWLGFVVRHGGESVSRVGFGPESKPEFLRGEVFSRTYSESQRYY
jgi:hypothetical protein